MPALLELHGDRIESYEDAALYGEMVEMWGDFLESLPDTVAVSLSGEFTLDDVDQWTLSGDDGDLLGYFVPEQIHFRDEITGAELGGFSLKKVFGKGFKIKLPKFKFPKFKGLGKFKLNFKLPKFKLPKFKAPKIDLKGISKPFDKLSRNVSRGFSDLAKSSGKFWGKVGDGIGDVAQGIGDVAQEIVRAAPDILQAIGPGGGMGMPGGGGYGEEMENPYGDAATMEDQYEAPDEYGAEAYGYDSGGYSAEPYPADAYAAAPYQADPYAGQYADQYAAPMYYDDPYTQGMYGELAGELGFLPAVGALLPGIMGAAGGAGGIGGLVKGLNPLNAINKYQQIQAQRSAMKEREKTARLKALAMAFRPRPPAPVPRPAPIARPRVYMRPAPQPGAMPRVLMKSPVSVERLFGMEKKERNTLLMIGGGVVLTGALIFALNKR